MRFGRIRQPRARFTSPRLRGEVDARSASGEGLAANSVAVEAPPHPNPPPASGAREQTESAASAHERQNSH
jgi:hypothetical protein